MVSVPGKNGKGFYLAVRIIVAEGIHGDIVTELAGIDHMPGRIGLSPYPLFPPGRIGLVDRSLGDDRQTHQHDAGENQCLDDVS